MSYIPNIGNKLHEPAAMYTCTLHMSGRNERNKIADIRELTSDVKQPRIYSCWHTDRPLEMLVCPKKRGECCRTIKMKARKMNGSIKIFNSAPLSSWSINATHGI